MLSVPPASPADDAPDDPAQRSPNMSGRPMRLLYRQARRAAVLGVAVSVGLAAPSWPVG
jgi:hypothetical protein